MLRFQKLAREDSFHTVAASQDCSYVSLQDFQCTSHLYIKKTNTGFEQDPAKIESKLGTRTPNRPNHGTKL
jgi:hypothetical protein